MRKSHKLFSLVLFACLVLGVLALNAPGAQADPEIENKEVQCTLCDPCAQCPAGITVNGLRCNLGACYPDGNQALCVYYCG